MSMYPQPQSMQYGGYQQPVPQQGYSYPVPPAPTMQMMDAHTFRQFFAARLAELTFNSRPIIQNLSFIASEYARMAHVVAQCLEAHIRVVSSQVKLPALYLLDAIAKNIHNPYGSVLAEPVVRIFVDAYEAVDQSTKNKMEEMLWTWRNGSPTGRELFGIVPQRNLENFIKAKHSTSHVPVPLVEHAKSFVPKVLTKGQVLAEIDVIVAQKEQALAIQYDAKLASQLSTLKQLHTVVRSTDISQPELGSILSQLRSLGSTSLPAAVQLSSTPVQATAPVQVIPNDLRAFLSQLAPTTSAPSQPARTSTPTATPPVNLSALLGTLVKSGVVSASNTPSGNTPLGAGATAEPDTKPAPDPEQIALQQYETDLLSLSISPSSTEIMKRTPRLIPFIYELQTAQCKQCAIRFPRDTAGKQKMDDHLDMHFRQNSSNIQAGGRGYSRSWFIGLSSWQRESKSNGREDQSTAIKSALERESELKRAFVVIPAGDETKTISCPICKEVLQPEFMEDNEDWVWRNAINMGGKIYHSTCYADAAAGATSLLSRIKQHVQSRSRSATPEAPTVPHDLETSTTEPPTTSSKRKASEFDDGDSSDQVREGTPPTKKFAVS